MISLTVNDLGYPVAVYPGQREAYFYAGELVLQHFPVSERYARQTVAPEAVILFHLFRRIVFRLSLFDKIDLDVYIEFA